MILGGRVSDVQKAMRRRGGLDLDGRDPIIRVLSAELSPKPGPIPLGKRRELGGIRLYEGIRSNEHFWFME
jgi:hypothetical protein